VLIHGLDVVYFQHDLDPSAGPLVGSQLNRMPLVKVRAQVQGDADRTPRERSIATRAFRRLLESKDAPVEIERGPQIVNEKLKSKGGASPRNRFNLLAPVWGATAAQRSRSAAGHAGRLKV
jgi:hypothetical protein